MYYLEQKYSYKKSIKNSDKEKYAYGGYEITFDSASSWSFDSSIAGNVAILVLIIVHHLIVTIIKITFNIRRKFKLWY